MVLNDIADWFGNLFKDKNVAEVEEAMERIREHTKNAEPGTPEWEKLREDMKKEEENLELAKRNGHFLGVSPEKWLYAALIAGLTIFAFSLDTESPTALKFAKTVCDFTRIGKG